MQLDRQALNASAGLVQRYWTGCPVIVSTSFNVGVASSSATRPEDAFRGFMGTEIEVQYFIPTCRR